MKLWHLHSKVLGGFYASEIIVIADNREQAKRRAVDAFKEHISDQLDDYGFFGEANSWEDDFDKKLHEYMQTFHEEVIHIREYEDPFIVFKVV